MTKNIFFQLGLGLLIGLIVILVSRQFFNPSYDFQGSLIEPPTAAPNFTLSDANGTDFSLSNFEGKIVLLYFGYTFCPDVCPTTLYEITRVRDSLAENKDKIIVAMITVDPERDPPEILSEYVSTFDPSFFGLSGSLSNLEKIWTDYGIYREEISVNGKSGYLIDHTARVFVIDQRGRLRLTFPFGMSWEAMSDDLYHLLENPGSAIVNY